MDRKHTCQVSKKLLVNFSVVLSAALIILLSAEIFVRCFKILERRYDSVFSRVNSVVVPSHNRELRYTLKPYFRGRIKSRRSEHSDTVYNINSLGLRGEEPQRGGNIINIVVIGDSMSFGLGVPEEFLYTYILKTGLHIWARRDLPGYEFEVYNCSVPGYNSEQEFLFCRKIVDRVKPEIILWQYCYNDILEPMEYALGNLIWNFGQRFPSHLLFMLNMFIHKDKKIEKIGYERAFRAIGKMEEMAKEINAYFITFIVPSAQEVDHLGEDVYRKEVSMLRAIPDSYYIDVLSGFKNLSSRDVMLHLKDDHLNPRGHRVVAGVLIHKIIPLLRRKNFSFKVKRGCYESVF